MEADRDTERLFRFLEKKGKMKAREIFLIFAAFTLLFILFCVVTLTGIDSDKSTIKPSPQLSSGSKTADTNRTFIHSSIPNLEKAAHQSESNIASLTVSSRLMNNRPDKPKMDAWSSSNRAVRSDIKDLLKPIESNGRVYLENTTGAIDCNEIDDGAIETIE